MLPSCLFRNNGKKYIFEGNDLFFRKEKKRESMPERKNKRKKVKAEEESGANMLQEEGEKRGKKEMLFCYTVFFSERIKRKSCKADKYPFLPEQVNFFSPADAPHFRYPQKNGKRKRMNNKARRDKPSSLPTLLYCHSLFSMHYSSFSVP